MNTTEIWLPIPSYEGLYEVSNCGAVRSFHSNNHRPTHSRISNTPRVLKLNPHKKGYMTVTLCLISGKKKKWLVHQLVAATFIGECPKGMEINHKDGVKSNNHADNLEYMTRQDNIIHKVNVLGKSRGEGQWLAKLNATQVLEIRKKYRTGSVSQKELSMIYSVHYDTINKIVTYINWKHLP